MSPRMNPKSDAIHLRQRWAWTFFALLSFPFLLVYFQRVAPAVVASELMKDYAISGQVLGSLAAIYFYIYTVLQIPAGLLADVLGSRKTVAIGSILAGCGSFLFGLAPNIELAFVGRFFVGMGVSFVFVPMLQIYGRWFRPEEFPKVSGFSLLIGSAGAVLASYPLGFVTATLGWRAVFIGVGFLGLLAGILCALFLAESPEDKGLPPVIPASSEPVVKKSIRELFLLVIRKPDNWVLFLIFFGIYGALMTFQGAWGANYLIQVLSRAKVDASMDILFMAIGTLVGSPFVGYLSGRTGKTLTILIGFLTVYCLSWFVLSLSDATTSILFLRANLFILGFSASSFILTYTLTRLGNGSSESGTALGLVNMGGFAGASVLQPAFGWVLDRHWDGSLIEGVRWYGSDAYRYGIYLCLGFGLLAMGNALLYALRRSKTSTKTV